MKRITLGKIFFKLYYRFINCKGIAVLFISMLTFTEAHPLLRRSATGRHLQPCFVLEKEGNRIKEPIQETLSDLILRTDSALKTPDKIQKFLRENYLLKPADIPSGTFLGMNDIVAPKATDTADISSLLSAHYSLLYKLVSFVEYARQNNKIGSDKGTDTIGDRLKMTRDELYQIMCDIKIGLIGQGSEVQSIADPHPVSQEFIAAGATNYNETRRVYIIMNDFRDIIQYLNDSYKKVKVKLTKSNGV